MRILILLGPNLNLLGWISRSTGRRLTLDRLEKAVRTAANGLGVDVILAQLNDEVKACQLVARNRSKVAGLLLVPGIWDRTGQQLQETVRIIGIPLALFQLLPEGGPWTADAPSLFEDIAVLNASGNGASDLAEAFTRFHALLARQGD